MNVHQFYKRERCHKCPFARRCFQCVHFFQTWIIYFRNFQRIMTIFILCRYCGIYIRIKMLKFTLKFWKLTKDFADRINRRCILGKDTTQQLKNLKGKVGYSIVPANGRCTMVLFVWSDGSAAYKIQIPQGHEYPVKPITFTYCEN